MNEITLTSWTPVIAYCRKLKRWKVYFCIYRVETAITGMRLYWFWLHPFVLLLEESGSVARVCETQFVTRVCNHYLKFTLQFTGLRYYNGKSVIIESWNIIRGKRITVPIHQSWDRIEYLLERNIIQLRSFFQQH